MNLLIGFQAPDGSTPQLLPVSAENPLPVYFPGGLPGGAVWGEITGTLSDQTDLQNALDAKQAVITAGDGLTFAGATLNLDAALTTVTSITSPGALTLATSANGDMNLAPNGTGIVRVGGTGLVVDDSSGTVRLYNGGPSLMAQFTTNSWRMFSQSLRFDGDVDLARTDANGLEINNGTPGTFRDLKLRNLTASGDTSVVNAQLSGLLYWGGSSVVQTASDGTLKFTNFGGTAGVTLDFATDAVFKLRNRANDADAALTALSLTTGAPTGGAGVVKFGKVSGGNWTVSIDGVEKTIAVS